MNIVIVGSGNVAAVLGRKLIAAGHTIVQIISRNATAASELAYEWDTESANYMTLINKTADLYIIAVSDNAIEAVAKELSLPGKVVVHTAAAVPMDVLKKVSAHYGVLYPLQSLRKEMNRLPDMPIYVAANDEIARTQIQLLADAISFQPPAKPATDELRLKLHVAAVLVSNFTNHLYALAEEYCKKEGIDFTQLRPLIEETALRIKESSPQQVQTGPAIRHDGETIKTHLSLLNNYPALKNIYIFLTESIQTMGKA
jgi:predicted short-subunit dehydrogenase-like oxidoreductase (DUF2520 family)